MSTEEASAVESSSPILDGGGEGGPIGNQDNTKRGREKWVEDLQRDFELYRWCSSCGTRHGHSDSTRISELALWLCPDCAPKFAHLIESRNLPDVPGQRLGES